MYTEFIPQEDFELITLAEAKRQLRLDDSFDDEDETLTGMIAAAVAAAEAYTERTLANGTLTLTLPSFRKAVCFEQWSPVVKNDVSVSIVPFGETEQVALLPGDFQLHKWDGNWQVYFSADLPVAEVSKAVVVTVTCKVPADVKAACLLKLAELYEIREDRPVGNNNAFEKLLRPYRKY